MQCEGHALSRGVPQCDICISMWLLPRGQCVREAGGSQEAHREHLPGLRWETAVAWIRVGGAVSQGLVKAGPGRWVGRISLKEWEGIESFICNEGR